MLKKVSIISAVLLGLSAISSGTAIAGSTHNYNLKVDVDGNGTDDFKLRVRTRNLYAGNCTVFLHGNSAPFKPYMQKTFRRVANSGHRCVIGFDFPGHGKTQNLNGYDLATGSIQEHVNSLSAVITDLGLTDYDVAGWSLGGDIAMQAYNQGLLTGVAGVALIGTPPVDLLGSIVDGAGNPIPSFQSASCASDVTTGVGTGGVPYNLVGALTAPQLSALVDSFFDDCTPPNGTYLTESQLTDPNARAGIFPSILAGEVGDEITILQNMVNAGLPVLFSYGANEELVNPAFMTATANFVGIPLADVVTYNSGHAALVEDPNGVKNALLDFIDSH